MGGKGREAKERSASQGAPSAEEQDSSFKLAFVEALNDPEVVRGLTKLIREANKDILEVVGNLRAEVKSLRDTVQQRDASINKLQLELSDLHMKYDALEQHGRRSSVRISGIPESEVDTDEAVVAIANDLLQLQPPLAARDIDVSHRLPSRRDSAEPRAVIVRFMMRKDRARFIAARKKLHPVNETRQHKLYINEDLTTFRAQLFSATRSQQKKGHIEQAWTFNGNIKIKDRRGQVKSIFSLDQLRKAIPEVNPNSIQMPQN